MAAFVIKNFASTIFFKKTASVEVAKKLDIISTDTSFSAYVLLSNLSLFYYTYSGIVFF